MFHDVRGNFISNCRLNSLHFVIKSRFQEKLSGKVDVDEYCKKYDEMAEEMLPKCSLMSGVLKFVRHLKVHNIPMAICTGSTRKEFELKTQCHKELLDLISLRVSFSVKRAFTIS